MSEEDEENKSNNSKRLVSHLEPKLPSYLYAFQRGACSYAFGGRIPTGPRIHQISNILFWILFVSIISIHCVASVPYVKSSVSVILLCIYIILALMTVLSGCKTQFTDAGRIPRRILFEKVKSLRESVPDLDDLLNSTAYAELTDK